MQNKVIVYERDGKDTKNHDDVVIVESHWNLNDRVTLVIGDQKVTVVARDLQAAITNVATLVADKEAHNAQ